ncbi:MAG: hypothetical protein ACRCVG_02085, partial [Methanobacteriaceae archaeon]
MTNKNLKINTLFIVLFFVLITLLSISSVSAAVTTNSQDNISIDDGTTLSTGLANITNGTIYLNDNEYNGSGNVNLTLSSRNLTIIGNNSTVINGSNVNWIFDIGGGSLTLINLTIT